MTEAKRPATRPDWDDSRKTDPKAVPAEKPEVEEEPTEEEETEEIVLQQTVTKDTQDVP